MSAPERHPHGTGARYSHGPNGDGVDPCRDACCRDALMAQRRRRQASRSVHTDAEPVRVHLAALRDTGLSIERIARRAGLHYRTIANVLYGQPCDGRPPPARVHRATAAKVLAVAVPTRHVGWLRPAGRTVGRLRVLVARGWSVPLLAEHLDLDRSHLYKLIHDDDALVTAATELAVIRLHKQLWPQQPPRSTRHERGAMTRAQRYAARHGWTLAARDDRTGAVA